MQRIFQALLLISFFVSCNRAKKPLTLRDNALYALNKIKQTEVQSDSTCWTTSKLMDQFAEGKEILPHTSVVKIELLKDLLYLIWRKASEKSNKTFIELNNIEKVIKPYLNDKALDLNLKDHKELSDSWKTIYAIIQDVFNGRKSGLIPLKYEALDRLGEIYPYLSLKLLNHAKRQADKNSHQDIKVNDFKSAFLKLANHYKGLKSSYKTEEINALSGGTKKYIADKVSSLISWNKGENNFNDVLKNLNQFLTIPISMQAFEEVFKIGTNFAKYVGTGYEGITSTLNLSLTFLKYYKHDGAKIPYLDLYLAYNAIDGLFPKEIKKNGDILFSYMTNFIYPINSNKPKLLKIRLNNFELDSIRDTAVHWKAMANAWENDFMPEMDPFAGDLLAESISEIFLFLLKKAELDAIHKGLKIIGKREINKIFDQHYYFIRSKEKQRWKKSKTKEKKKILDRLKLPFFLEYKNKELPLCKRKRVYEKGIEQYSHSYQFLGSGVAVGDVNNDGFTDIFLPGEGCNRLLINRRGKSLIDKTKAWGLSNLNISWSTQALFVDVNNDGNLDLFIVDSAGKSKLLIQQNDTFKDVTKTSGILTKKYATSATFFDYDNDGLLDLYIVYYGQGYPSLSGRNGVANQLFKNLGNNKFKDYSKKSGLDSTGWAMVVSSVDINMDGKIDVWVGNGNGPDEVFINQGDGTFIDTTEKLGLYERGDTMNIGLTDFDQNGKWDIFLTVVDMFSKNIRLIRPQRNTLLKIDDYILQNSRFLTGNKLLLNFYPKEFKDPGQIFEPGEQGLSWGGNFFDYENDGDEDLYLANGFIDGVYTGNQKNLFFIREGDVFFNLSKKGKSPESFLGNSRSVGVLDINNDGKMDLVVTNYMKRAKFLINNSKGKNNWIKVRLKGKSSNRFGIGSVVKIYYGKDKKQMKMITAGSNYLSQNDQVLSFGMGKEKLINRLEVIWPGGRKQVFQGPFKTGSVMNLTEKEKL